MRWTSIITELFGQFGHHVREDDRVQILRQEVDKEPVANRATVGDHIRLVFLRRRQPVAEQQSPHGLHGDDEYTDEEIEARDDGQDDEPEPEERVDFLVHYVQCQDAHCVMSLNGTCK